MRFAFSGALGLHCHVQHGRHIVVKLDRNLMRATFLNGTLKLDPMTVDFHLATEFRLEALGDVSRCDRTESLARLTSFQLKVEFQLADAAGKFLCLVQFTCFAFGAAGGEPQGSLRAPCPSGSGNYAQNLHAPSQRPPPRLMFQFSQLK